MKINFLNYEVNPYRKNLQNVPKVKVCTTSSNVELPVSKYHYSPPFVVFGSNTVQKKIDDYFDESKCVNAKAWVDGECVNNPESSKYLTFLESLNYQEKKLFVKKYMETTGFPDFERVNSNMKKEITEKINILSKKEDFTPLSCNFNASCSAGKSLSLPGSDIDGLTFLIDTQHPEETQFYRYLLGQSINQRLLETGADHYPEVISLQEFEHYMDEAEKGFRKENFTDFELQKFADNTKTLNKDFVEAADFNIRISKNINSDPLRRGVKQSKYDFLATCQFIENYRQNKDNVVFNNLDNNTKKLIENSCLYKYSNITQQAALSKHTKDKLNFRKEFLKDFRTYSAEMQFNIVKNLIYKSFATEPLENYFIPELFSNKDNSIVASLDSLVDMYQKLVEE